MEGVFRSLLGRTVKMTVRLGHSEQSAEAYLYGTLRDLRDPRTTEGMVQKLGAGCSKSPSNKAAGERKPEA